MRRALVEGRCPRCGSVIARASSLICGLSLADHGALCELACPECGRRLFWGLHELDVGMLFDLGARRGNGSLPFELLEPHDGPAVSWDEVLDFHVKVTGTCCPQQHLFRGRAA